MIIVSDDDLIVFSDDTKNQGVSETLCMRVSPCEFGGSFVEPFWV